MSINASLTFIGICLLGIMLFVMLIAFIFASRFDYDKAKATQKHNDEHIHNLIKKYMDEEI